MARQIGLSVERLEDPALLIWSCPASCMSPSCAASTPTRASRASM